MSENNLGAPTEGLGQNVTFSFDAPGGVPQVQPVQGGPGDVSVAGVSGQNATRTATPQFGTSTRYADMWKLVGKIAEPMVKDLQARELVRGMQQAASGHAVSEIAADRPFFAEMFGLGDAKAGAQTYYAEANVQRAVTAATMNIEKLASVPPDEAAAIIAKRVDSQLTGDAQTDAAIMSSWARHTPSLMKLHTKEHIAYNQGQAVKAEGIMQGAAMQQLQALGVAKSRGTMNQEEFDIESMKVIQTLIPAQGRNPDTYSRDLGRRLSAAAARGDLHALNAIMESGVLEHVLDPQDAQRVETARSASESKIKARYSFEWAPDLAALTHDARHRPGYALPDLRRDMASLNSRYRAVTGSRQDLVTGDAAAGNLAALAGSILDSQVKQTKELTDARKKAEKDAETARKSGQDARDKEEAKLELAKREQDSAIDLANRGMPGYAEELYGKSQASRHIYDAWKAQPLAGQLNVMAQAFDRESYVNGHLKNQFSSEVQAASADPASPAFQVAYDRFVQVQQANPAMASEYYGKQYKPMLAYHTELASIGSTPGMEASARLVAYKKAFLDPLPSRELNKEQEGDLPGAINKALGNRLPDFFDDTPKLHQQAQNLLRGPVGHYLRDYPGDFDDGVKAAVVAATQPGKPHVELLGEFAVRTEAGQRPAYAMSAKYGPAAGKAGDPVLIGKAFSKVVRDTAKAVSGDTQVQDVFRVPDAAGRANFIVMSMKDGRPVLGTFDSALIDKAADDIVEERNTHWHTPAKPGTVKRMSQLHPFVIN